ncbi:MAG: hypothetical protein RBR22_12515, partial [Desulfuromonas sp.]|nr:hypothetical protein [Desulfuromonas sp.]
LISYPAIASSPLVCETSLTTSTYQTGAMATYQLFTAVYGLDRANFGHYKFSCNFTAVCRIQIQAKFCN